MMKTCKIVLRTVRAMHHEQKRGPNFQEIAARAGLPAENVLDACKILTGQWYFEYLYPAGASIDGRPTPPRGVRLTLKGEKPLEYAVSQVKEFLKSNWMALLSLVVSVAALGASILSALFPDVVRVILL